MIGHARDPMHFPPCAEKTTDCSLRGRRPWRTCKGKDRFSAAFHRVDSGRLRAASAPSCPPAAYTPCPLPAPPGNPRRFVSSCPSRALFRRASSSGLRRAARRLRPFAKTEIFPKYLDVVQTLGVIKTGFIGTVDDDGALNLYGGKIRIMKPDGKFDQFDVSDYEN